MFQFGVLVHNLRKDPKPDPFKVVLMVMNPMVFHVKNHPKKQIHKSKYSRWILQFTIEIYKKKHGSLASLQTCGPWMVSFFFGTLSIGQAVTSTGSKQSRRLNHLEGEKCPTTPAKTNMEHENGSLKKEIPFGNHHFQVPC